ncbi:MAG TPA: pilin [Candidatus Dormibacteraeota bacterium]|nr:pilin [Candidatus Dormibacteraeota bacterium]
MKIKYIKIKLLITSIMMAGVFLTLGISRVNALSTICNSSATAGNNVSSSAFCKDTQTTNPIIGTNGVLNDVINIITVIAGFVAVIMIIVAGLQMITSSGKPEKISNARNTIIYASIGLIVIVLARIIIGFIISRVP